MTSETKMSSAEQLKWTKNCENVHANEYTRQLPTLKPRYSDSVSGDDKREAWQKIVRAVNRYMYGLDVWLCQICASLKSAQICR